MKDRLDYGLGLPYLKNRSLPGKLIVIEGPDCSGRSTQVALLKEWLEIKGHAVLDIGLKRSTLVGNVISKAKKGNILGKTTSSLLYCTDFADQMENRLIPALTAGNIVLSDRYIYTLMARDTVRGAEKDWLKKLFGFALIPDMVFYLDVNPDILLYRSLIKYGQLDYWESGLDLHLSPDMIGNFKEYHNLLKKEYDHLIAEYGFIVVSGEESVRNIHKKIKDKVDALLTDHE